MCVQGLVGNEHCNADTCTLPDGGTFCEQDAETGAKTPHACPAIIDPAGLLTDGAELHARETAPIGTGSPSKRESNAFHFIPGHRLKALNDFRQDRGSREVLPKMLPQGASPGRAVGQRDYTCEILRLPDTRPVRIRARVEGSDEFAPPQSTDAGEFRVSVYLVEHGPMVDPGTSLEVRIPAELEMRPLHEGVDPKHLLVVHTNDPRSGSASAPLIGTQEGQTIALVITCHPDVLRIVDVDHGVDLDAECFGNAHSLRAFQGKALRSPARVRTATPCQNSRSPDRRWHVGPHLLPNTAWMTASRSASHRAASFRPAADAGSNPS